MTEQTETAVAEETPLRKWDDLSTDEQGVLNAEIAEGFEAIKNMSKEELGAFALERGEEYQVDNVNSAWLRRKCQRLHQAMVLKGAGVEPPDSHAKNDAKLDKSKDKTKGEAKKPGRKAMIKTGKFAVVQIDEEKGQSLGRQGSTKYGIMVALNELDRAFTYNEFEEIVANVMGWNPSTSEFEKCNSRFENATKAASAWFSELKNKFKLIEQVQKDDPEAESNQ